MTFLSSEVVFWAGMGVYPCCAALEVERHRCLTGAECEEITF